MSLFDKLDEAELKYKGILETLSEPSAASDIENYKRLNKDRKTLEPVIEKYREYKNYLSQLKEAEELLESDGTDEEIRLLAQMELEETRPKADECEEELKTLLLPKDEDDDRSVVFEIRAGAGGEEAALFAAVLFRMYSMYAMSMGYKLEITDANETELGGYKEIIFTVEGEGAYSRLKFESGVHRVQRVPQTAAQGRIQTSTATVAVLPQAKDVEIEVRPEDIKMETAKSSGAGGQHVNKTESAVRLTYLPTGMVVECQEERSQFKNRDKAMKLLKTRLLDIKRTEAHEKRSNERRSQVGTGDRSERIRTYNYPQSRITDHRIGKTVYSLEAYLNGDLNEMIDALTAADTAEKLKNSEF